MVTRGSCVLALLAGSVAWGQNLLENPGFETLDGSVPARWRLFVMPGPGAEGRLDARAYEGRYAAMLHTAAPYAKEPANNWSQNVLAEVAGKTLRLSGAVRTDEATEAALWLQCWSRPWTLRRVVTTSADTPLYGTRDWTNVSMTVEVPEGTDFVVVRCVLLGSGTAWFDAITLEEHTAAPGLPAEHPGEPPVTAEPFTGSSHVDMTENLIEANVLLADTVEVLRERNDTLAKQLALLEAQVRELREQVALQQALLAPTTSATPARIPPLVPHGYNVEELVR